MKKLLIITVFSFAFFLVGCSVNDAISETVEKSYTVIVKGIDAIDHVAEQISGSPLGEEVGDDLASIRNALEGLKATMVSVGTFVGADIPVEMFSVGDPIIALDVATEDMIRSREKIE